MIHLASSCSRRCAADYTISDLRKPGFYLNYHNFESFYMQKKTPRMLMRFYFRSRFVVGARVAGIFNPMMRKEL